MLNLILLEKVKTMSIEERVAYGQKQAESHKHVKMGLDLFKALPEATQAKILEGWASDMDWIKGRDMSDRELLELLTRENAMLEVTFGDFGVNENVVKVAWSDVYYNDFEVEDMGAEWMELAFPEVVEAEATQTVEVEATEAIEAVEAEQGEQAGAYPDYDYRICYICEEKMYDGFVVGEIHHFCSDKCLHEIYTPEEYENLYEEDDAYWTEGFSGWCASVEKHLAKQAEKE